MNAAKTSPPLDGAEAVKIAALEVIRDNGLGAFSVREVARRAGLSHAAPGYFYGGSQGLLTAIATEGFETLRREMVSAAADLTDPVDTLVAIGRAYVRVATQYPSHCEVMFRTDVVDVDNQQLQHAGLTAYGELEIVVAGFASVHNPSLNITAAARLCWSAMQGLVQLRGKLQQIDQMDGVSFEIEQQAETLCRLLITGLMTSGR